MKLNKVYIIISILLLSCSNKDENKILTEDFQNNNDEPTAIETSTDIDGELNVATIEPSSPFYPLKESIYDIQNQINELKSKVVEYESELHNPSIDIELLKMIKTPQIKHEIKLNNGTIIQGEIISENSNMMIVQTQIGQLTIEKELVVEINEVDPITSNLIFVENEVEERIEENNYTYIGKVKNTGGVRADFVQVIYHFWKDDTNPIISDTVYVQGNNMIYMNGVISDSAVEPTQFANYILNVNLPDSLNIEYHTKEIQWDNFK